MILESLQTVLQRPDGARIEPRSVAYKSYTQPALPSFWSPDLFQTYIVSYYIKKLITLFTLEDSHLGSGEIA